MMLVCLLGGTIVTSAASTYSYVTISKGQDKVESSSVGVSTSAKYFAYNNSASLGSLTMDAYACWTGWPYTKEYSISLSPSDSISHIETQSKNSSFYMVLKGNKQCDGEGYVEAR